MRDMRVSGLWRFPLKSGRAERLDKAGITANGIAGDRAYMVVDDAGVQVTAREMPGLLKVGIEHANGRERLVLSSRQQFDIPEYGVEQAVSLFSDPLQADDAGGQIARALSEHLGRSVRLVRRHKGTRREYGGAHYGAFGDVAPLLIINQASLDALNEQLSWPVDMSRFRPNIVVSGAAPFAEDGWARLRIGALEFEVVEPCARCVMTMIDPATGRKDHGQQPLRHLSTFRSDESGGIHFGVYARPLTRGEIAIGDGVEAQPRDSARVYPVGTAGIGLPADRYLLRIIGLEQAAEQARHIWLRFEDQPWGAPIMAGQFVTLRLPQPDGSETVRSFTISARRSQGREIRLSVRQQGRGGVSDFLVNGAHAGDTLWASGIHGDFTFDDGESAGVFLSAGSGVTPFLAMLQDRGTLRDVVHLHTDRTKSRAIAIEELEAAAARLPGYQFRPHWSADTGRLGKADLAGIERIGARKVWLCGPEGFVTEATDWLRQLGVPEDRIVTETFTRPKTGEQTGQTFEVVLDDEEAVRVDAGVPLLGALRAAGLSLPSSCEIGSCGTCRLRLIEGECKSAAPAPQDGTILPCISFARSNLRLQRINALTPEKSATPS